MLTAGVLAILSGLTAQALKVLLELLVHRSWQPRLFVRNGGMPSSHTASVVTLAILVGQEAGVRSPVFSLVVVFGLYVIFEATGLRQEVGEQARLLNDLVETMRRTHHLAAQDLREFVGHTWAEVAVGAVCGTLFAVPFL
ncbi:MAG TPA: divergent PAP2 family protein [Candidatus Krumholzibacteria bacterium]|nr:divergent PAP2 family protein [Candidatus Krumholzibacteria bacterium]HPD71753.1 divergent PAP2 family protein [Candidatus Krumholzibacteria bacterium]HRY41314.1 divergent PAP2 family protein [Candidatus Krumholzibacteria bacterium]